MGCFQSRCCTRRNTTRARPTTKDARPPSPIQSSQSQPLTIKKEYLVIAGYQFVISDEDDASEYLKCVMKKVFDGKLGGHTKIVVAFPDLYLQSCTPRTNTAEKKTVEKMLSVPRTAVAYNYGASSDDVQVELVGVTITHSIQHAHRIRDIIRDAGHEPEISLVYLVDSSTSREALTVEPGTGRVYFQTFTSNVDLDENSYFFRVRFSLDIDTSVIIWIVLSTLAPIGVDSNDDLYAKAPFNGSPAEDFLWLSSTLNDGMFLFQVHGNQTLGIIHLKDDHGRRIVRGNNTVNDSPVAVIDDGCIEFAIHVRYIY